MASNTSGNTPETGPRPIRLLDDRLRDQIAAGEVVERPASVVKELVENSLDAGSSRVEIRIERGGQGLIQVADNGSGMAPDQMALAVTRHATSKITDLADLAGISSFGFRGEALPSIASVSRFTLTSTPAGADQGWRLAMEDGLVADQGPAPPLPGTSVAVRDLFANVPARLKFLKTEATEARRVRDIVGRFALSRLDAGFELTSSKKPVLAFAPAQTLSQRLEELWPQELARKLLEFDYSGQGYRAHGLAGHPDTAQARADRMLFFVNSRPVQDRVLMQAAREAYKGRLLSREYPQLVLFLELPRPEVDVNVHPAKAEVRFRDESMVFATVKRAVGQALDAARVGFTVRPPSFSGEQAAPYSPSSGRPDPAGAPLEASEPDNPHSPRRESWREYQRELDLGPKGAPTGGGEATPRPDLDATDAHGTVFHHGQSPDHGPGAEPGQAGDDLHHPGPEQAPGPDGRQDPGPTRLPGARYLGQVAGTYLVLAGDDGSLVMVDQHAAHERVLYESYRRQGRGGTSRDLAIPLDMPLHASQARVLRDSRSILSSLGFWLEIREAGATIKAVPGAMDPGEARSFLESAASGQVEGLEDLWVLLACRQAMKAAQPLAPGEAAQLLEAWLETENRDHCPHGRPVTARLTLRDMEKLFKRGK